MKLSANSTIRCHDKYGSTAKPWYSIVIAYYFDENSIQRKSFCRVLSFIYVEKEVNLAYIQWLDIVPNDENDPNFPNKNLFNEMICVKNSSCLDIIETSNIIKNVAIFEDFDVEGYYWVYPNITQSEII